MKRQLLLLFSIASFIVSAQAPIDDFFGDPMGQYAVVTGTIDHSPVGANATWNFSGLTQIDTTTDTFAAPTAADLANYPGTTQVLSTTNTAMDVNQVFYDLTEATLSLTGTTNPEFTLDYNTDNAEIGTYPLTFGAVANNDNIAGTIDAQGQSPSYTGTINTEVDAYGTLSFDVIGLDSYSGSVTRIMTTQNISFVATIFPGTASITSYNYYKDSDGALVFRTSDGTVSVPGLGINDSFSIAEGLITDTLSKSDIETQGTVQVYPNPVGDRLYIEMGNSIVVRSIRIVDSNGRMLLSSAQNNNGIDVSWLSPGFYTVLITTDKGIMPRKLVKR